MLLRDTTGRDLISAGLRSELPAGALRELLDLAAGRLGLEAQERDAVLAEVLKRNDRIPCGLGRGLAFPNARIAGLAAPTLAIGVSRRGLDFRARDGKPAHVIFLYLGRAEPSDEERQMLSRVSQALADAGTTEALMAASTADEIWEAVLAIDAREKARAT